MSLDPRSILETLGSARRFADPEGPSEARMMAARGALPLPPAELVSILLVLTVDPDLEVKERALQTLDGLPARVLDTALEAPVQPQVLAFFADRLRNDEPRLLKIALNPATSDESLCLLATLPFPSIIDIIARNQVRLLACPALFESLGENPLTSQATVDRILEFLGLSQEPEAQEETPRAASTPSALAPDGPPALDPSNLSGLPEELLEESPEGTEAGGEGRKRSLTSLLDTMTVVEKIKLARFGNMEARGLLVRDRNRIVSSAAIRSPKITDNEVLMFAKSRNLSEDVLRIIATTREWTKNYPVQLALSTNPKTPLTSSIKFLNYLTDRDLKTIVRSRDVPSAVCQQARRILSRKGKV